MTNPQDAENLDGVAIIGMVGRFPGASNVEQLWQNLCEGVASTTFFSDEELDPNIDEVLRKNPNYVKAKGIIEDADQFDAAFFGINPREAEMMDPQQRVFLELAQEALENSGYVPENFDGLIGLYAGAGYNNYLTENICSRRDIMRKAGEFYTYLANDKDFLATRASYKLNLTGPSVGVHTACSTALVAVIHAFNSLMSYQCDLALAGGISISVPIKKGYLYQEGAIFSPDGYCRPFDAKAQGTMFNDGAGVVVLKRLEDALEDGDRIEAVIRGVGMNNDGSSKVSFTAPSIDGQAEAIAMAHAYADIDPETITFIEAHGTATPLGDPIEIAALTQAFRAQTDAKNFCAIGSIKSNVGHLVSAAGVAGLIKAALALRHKKIPGTLHFTEPNPELDLENSPFFVNAELMDWEAGESPRRAGISSFGVGGTNAHVVLEEAPAIEPSGPSRSRQLLLLSAKTPEALDRATGNLGEFLSQNPDLNLADVAYTLQVGRQGFAHRRLVVCKEGQDAVQALRSLPPQQTATRQMKSKPPEVGFMFPGQGTQYVNMGLNLYESEPLFRETVDRCAQLLKPHLGCDLRDLLYPKDGESEEAAAALRETRITQPAIFTIEYALAKLWQSWGIEPTALIGHSIGEFVAATISGVFSLEDGLMLIAKRGSLMQDLPSGSMLSVRTNAAEVEPRLGEELSVAAVNGPSLCVVSGPTEVIEKLQAELEAEQIMCKYLHTSHAFHSPMMDPIVEPFAECCRSVTFSAPQIPFVSTVTAQWITPEQATNPQYWADHLRATVRFAEGVQTLWEDPDRVLLEVGTRMTATTLARQQAKDLKRQIAIPSLGTTAEDSGEWTALLTAIGQLWLTGVSIDWNSFYEQETRRRVVLPTYPFERKRFWIEPRRAEAVPTAPASQPQPTPVAAPQAASAAPSAAPAAASRQEQIIPIIKTVLEDCSGLDLSNIDGNTTFLEMGLDSLALTQAVLDLELEFGVQVTFRRLLETFPTIATLAAFLDEEMSPDAMPDLAPAAPQPASPPPPSPTASAPPPVQLAQPAQPVPVAAPGQASLLDSLANQQLQLMAQQTELMKLMSKQLDRLMQEAESASPKFVAEGDRASSDRAEASFTITPVVNTENLPLSFAQERLWVLQQMAPDSTTYNLPEAVRLVGEIDISALEQGLNEILRRHEILRATFQQDGEAAVQKIGDLQPFKLPVIDLKSLPEAEREPKAQQLLTQEAQRPFDLEKDLLLRASVVELDAQNRFFFFCFHHIASDGWSIATFKEELVQLYEVFSQGQPSPLPELPTQYADFACWQRQWLQGGELEEQLDYWREQLSGEIPALKLPKDLPPPSIPSYDGDNQYLVLSDDFTATLKQFSRKQGASLFMTLLAAFGIMLNRYTGQEDIVLCSPIAGRTRAEIKPLIGYFNNIFILRTNLSGDPTGAEIIKRVRNVVLSAYENQDVPFQDVSALPNLSRLPLSSGLFNLLPKDEPLSLSGSESEAVLIDNGTADFDLSIEIEDRESYLRIRANYKTDCFTQSAIADILSHFQTVLEKLVSESTQPLSSLPRWQAPEVDIPAESLQQGELEAAPYVAPRDEVESKLVEIWQDCLGVERLGIKDNFFDLGGRSLMAARMSDTIQKTFERKVPFATIFQAPTIEELAQILREDSWTPTWKALAPVQPQGSKPALFLCQGAGIYSPLIPHLGMDQPIYGLVALTPEGEAAPYESVEILAAEYIEEMRQIQPKGPYLVGGISWGGVIAFEMAQQLVSQGHEVGCVALLDTILPEAYQAKPLPQRLAVHLKRTVTNPAYVLEKAIDILSSVAIKVQRLYGQVALKAGLAVPKSVEYYAMQEVNDQAVVNYEPQLYPGQLTVFKASNPADLETTGVALDNGWTDLAGGGLEIFEIPGTHLGILQEPDVAVLAEKLKICIDRAIAE